MYLLDNISFEKYLRAVLTPKERFLWPEGMPEILTPSFNEAVRLYLKHHPNEKEQPGNLQSSYYWIWNGFKEEVESNAINLNVSEVDRKRYFTLLFDWFTSLQPVKEEYQQLFNALSDFKAKQIPKSTTKLRYSSGEKIPEWERDYFFDGEGTSMGRAKAGLEWCIYIIKEGKKLIVPILESYNLTKAVRHNTPSTSPTIDSGIVNTSQQITPATEDNAQTVKLSHVQISILHHLEGWPINKNNAQDIASRYGHKSGQKLNTTYENLTSELTRTAKGKLTVKNYRVIENIVSTNAKPQYNKELKEALNNNK